MKEYLETIFEADTSCSDAYPNEDNIFSSVTKGNLTYRVNTDENETLNRTCDYPKRQKEKEKNSTQIEISDSGSPISKDLSLSLSLSL